MNRFEGWWISVFMLGRCVCMWLVSVVILMLFVLVVCVFLRVGNIDSIVLVSVMMVSSSVVIRLVIEWRWWSIGG